MGIPFWLFNFEIDLAERPLLRLFIKIDAMSPTEFQNGGERLCINYSYAETPFGPIMMGATSKGICHLSFIKDEVETWQILKTNFPNALYTHQKDNIQEHALCMFSEDWNKLEKITLHVKGTPFQLKVWETLLQIPRGKLSTYGRVAKQIQSPQTSRAVGRAVGANPIAYLIPCHRVVPASGACGEYHWDSHRKRAMIDWEATFYK